MCRREHGGVLQHDGAAGMRRPLHAGDVPRVTRCASALCVRNTLCVCVCGYGCGCVVACGGQLEDLVKHKIDDAFTEHIDFEDAREKFMDVMALALKVVVRRVECLCTLRRSQLTLPHDTQSHGLACMMDSQLVCMMKTKWDTVSGVGDQSGVCAVPTPTPSYHPTHTTSIWVPGDKTGET